MQTTQVVRNATDTNPGLVMDYVTIWKLTLMNYNVGPTCVLNAVAKAWEETPSSLNWAKITQYVTGKVCERGVVYSNQITEHFYNPPQ
jgi:hypothetical protein